jgi:hypothetical protein
MPTDIVTLLISTSIRICGLALVAFASLSVFRLRASAARHAMWTVALVGILLQIPRWLRLSWRQPRRDVPG